MASKAARPRARQRQLRLPGRLQRRCQDCRSPDVGYQIRLPGHPEPAQRRRRHRHRRRRSLSTFSPPVCSVARATASKAVRCGICCSTNGTRALPSPKFGRSSASSIAAATKSGIARPSTSRTTSCHQHRSRSDHGLSVGRPILALLSDARPARRRRPALRRRDGRRRWHRRCRLPVAAHRQLEPAAGLHVPDSEQQQRRPIRPARKPGTSASTWSGIGAATPAAATRARTGRCSMWPTTVT